MSDTSKEPKMIALKCPQCGGALELDTDKEVATCPYCNTRLLIVRSIEQNNVINYNIRIEDNGKKNSKSSFPFEKPDSGRINEIKRFIMRVAAAAAVIIAVGLFFKACGAVMNVLSGGGKEKEETARETEAEEENVQTPLQDESGGRVIDVPRIDTEIIEVNPVTLKKESVPAAEFKEFPVSFTQKGQETDLDVTIPNPGNAYVFISEMRNDTYVEIDVFDEKGNRTSRLNYGRNNSGVMIKTSEPDEKYTIRVVQSEGLGDFLIRVGMPKSVKDLGDITVLSDHIDYTDQSNLYTLTAAETGIYSFFVNEMMADMNVSMELYDRLGAKVRSASYVNNNKGIWADLKAGETYTLAVNQNESTGSYDLLIGRQKKAVDFEGHTHLKDSTEFAHQRNFYTFTAAADGDYRVEMTDINTNNSFELSVYDRLDQRIGILNTYNRSNSGRTFTDLKAGEQYKVYVEQSEGLGTYKLSVYRPKDVVEITEGDTVKDSIEFEDQTNTYSFTASKKGDSTLTISGLNGDSAVVLYVYNDRNEKLYTDSYFVNGDSVTFRDNNPGTHALIYIEEKNGKCDYVLTMK